MDNEKAFKLTQIAVFNPHRLDDKTAKALFVVRTKLFDYLMNELNDETKDSIAQNHLIIASRGMGKTSLLKRIQIEIKESKLSKLFIPILYQEEQYNITNLNDLWYNSLDKLADLMDDIGNKKLVITIDKKIEELKSIKNKTDSNTFVYDSFMSFCNELDRRPILLLDNISLIFKRLDKDNQHLLRKILIEKKAPILIAASPIKVDEVLEYGAPFYDAFQIHYIEKLSNDELFIILNNLIKLTKSEELTSNLYKNSARIKVINKLTGGNPRTAVMLFKLIVKGFSKELKDDLEALLDEVTPLYKARFEEELSPQSQIIMNAIANNWHPIGLKKLGTYTNLPNNKLQPQLTRLFNAGWINKNKIKGHNTLYEVNERFFNIWYLMRQSNRRDKKQVTYLSHFLESLYTSDLLNANAKILLNQKSSKSSHIMYQLAFAESTEDKKLKKQLINKAKKDLGNLEFLNRNEKKKYEELIKQYDNDQTNIVSEAENEIYWPSRNTADKLIEKGDFIGAEKILKKYLKTNPESEIVWNQLGILYHVNLNNYKKAEKAYKKALKINSKNEVFWSNLGLLYSYHLNKYKKAEEIFNKVIEINPKYIDAWIYLGNLYLTLKKYKIAEETFKKATKINSKHEKTWYNLGLLYFYNLNKYDKALEIFKKIIKINPESDDVWNSLGNLYQDYIKNYNEAEKAYKKVLEINPKQIVASFNLVFLLRDKLNKTAEAKKLFYTIKNYKEVIDSYYLNLSLFDLYENNLQNAKNNLSKAISHINSELPYLTQDDWWRYAAISTRLGYTEWFLEQLKNNDLDVILAPFYEAVYTFTLKEKDIEAYLSTKALEIRDATYFVLEKIKNYA